MRTIIKTDPYPHLDEGKNWFNRGDWPCRWVCCLDALTPAPQAGAHSGPIKVSLGPPPFVTAYRRRFALDHDATIRIHVSADERYELFLDGQRLGRGPERGDARNWFFETFDLDLPRGEHVFVARVWSLGNRAPYAQMSVHPGFLFSPQDQPYIDLLGTGIAPWEAKLLGGYEFADPGIAWGTGANVVIDAAAFPFGFERGEGDGWKPATALEWAITGSSKNEQPPVHRLKPATLPAMLEVERQIGTVRFVGAAALDDLKNQFVRMQDHLPDEAPAWQALLDGRGSVTVPAHTTRRVIVDLGNYYCAYPELVTTGGGSSPRSFVRLDWAESLVLPEPGLYGVNKKGHRDQIEGKLFHGVGDTFKPDGGAGRRFDTLWWQAGRYVQFVVRAEQEPLTLERFALRETRYPLEMEGAFSASDARLEHVLPVMVRGLQMCAHETYFDCPYYEQLMYVGDTRLEVLTTYCVTRDDRLPRKALRMFDESRLPTGLTQSRYPSRVLQTIPPFSLWWVGMICDFALWRDDPVLVRQLMAGGRGVIDGILRSRRPDGLIGAPLGWNYMDWVPAWTEGIPADGDFGVGGELQWQTALILTLKARVEDWLGEKDLAKRDRTIAREIAEAATAKFWSAKRKLLADDFGKKHFSEHTQCLALLSGLLPKDKAALVARGLVDDLDLYRTTIYFTHYLFETYRLLGRMDKLFERLELWFEHEKVGLRTTMELPEPTRSDCHAWGAHPIYHYFASILGIRPGGFGFATVDLRPQLGPLTQARGKLAHPRGWIEVDFRVEDRKLRGGVKLPKGLTGTLTWGGKRTALKSGAQKIG